ncbi:MAG: glycerophosphodiester phosphodiesterase, partial [Clostridiales bacterium]|nr:glycerophosphodiester phosphodiesterase [Clostridiales bacterium]
MNTIKIDHGNVKMVAHRGVSGLELENTNAAFVAAGNRSYYGIETDVHVTLDGKFVCFHDDNTGRVAI